MLLLLISPSLVYGVHLSLYDGKENELCRKIFDLRLSNIKKTFADSITHIADENGIPKWGEGRLLKNPKYRERSSLFDIDNDGVNESVSSLYTGLGGHLGQYYRVVNENELKTLDKVTEKELYSFPGIYSNTPWPYKRLGLYFFSIHPFKFNGVFYLGLKDNKFGEREFLERSFLIVKYTNEMLRFGQNNWGKTSKLQVICKFMYANKS